jgi:hypothetical protein
VAELSCPSKSKSAGHQRRDVRVDDVKIPLSGQAQPELYESVGGSGGLNAFSSSAEGAQHAARVGQCLFALPNVEGHLTPFLVDTGAQVSLVRGGVSSATVKTSSLRVRGVSGASLGIKGSQC